MELIIHNRCSEMFSRIYDGAQRNSQLSLWCCFSLLSYKDKGLHRERMSAQPFSPPPTPKKKFPRSLRLTMRDGSALIDHRAPGPWGEVCSFIPMILCGLWLHSSNATSIMFRPPRNVFIHIIYIHTHRHASGTMDTFHSLTPHEYYRPGHAWHHSTLTVKVYIIT